jgi:hypothetical protein
LVDGEWTAASEGASDVLGRLFGQILYDPSGETTKGTKGEAKGEEEIYSRITRFTRLEEMSLPHTP